MRPPNRPILNAPSDCYTKLQNTGKQLQLHFVDFDGDFNILTAFNVNWADLYVHRIQLKFHLAGDDGMHASRIAYRLIFVQCNG